jgi:hypothetical protein
MQAEHGRSSPLIRAMHMALMAARAWAHSPGHSRLPLQSRPGVSQDGEAVASRDSFQAGFIHLAFSIGLVLMAAHV